MGDEANKPKFTLGKSKPASGEQDGKPNESTTTTESPKSTDQNVGGESGGFKQIDTAATTLKDNAESSNNSTATNEPGKGAAPSNEGNTGGVADNGSEATQARLDQSNDMKPIEGAKSGGYNPPESAYRGPTIDDLGLNRDQLRSLISEAFANQAAADAGVTADDEVVYSSHPIQNFQIGPYHFEKTILKLNREQSVEFDKLLASMPMTESKNVTKIDVGKVDQIVANRLGGATQQFDSSAGRAALEELSKQYPKVGTESIEDLHAFAKGQLTDENQPVPLNPFDVKFNDNPNG